MKYPKYIAVVINGKRGSHMELINKYYDTCGWSISVKNLKYNKDLKVWVINNFMDHLDGSFMEPISESVFKKGKWGVKSKIKEIE